MSRMDVLLTALDVHGRDLHLLAARLKALTPDSNLVSRQPELDSFSQAASAESVTRLDKLTDDMCLLLEELSQPHARKVTIAEIYPALRQCFIASETYDELESPMYSMQPTQSLSPCNAMNTLKSRVDAMVSFADPGQTLIIYDWDDTLFPTTWVVDDMHLTSSEEQMLGEVDRLTLQECSLCALTTLRFAASAAAQVLIVTLARKGWLESCIKRFAPDLDGELEKAGVRIVYARDCLDNVPNDSISSSTSNDWKTNPWVRAKGKAIARECDAFYEGRSWSNIVAVGDAEYEILGSQMAVQGWAFKNRRVALQLPRLKTVKFISEPSCKQLIMQLEALEELLPVLVGKDLSISIDMADLCKSQSNPNQIGSSRRVMAHELLVKAESNVAEPFSDAVTGGVLWKLCEGSAPSEPDRWRQRRVWLSRAGRLWYESLERAQPEAFFHGLSVAHISVTALGHLGGDHISLASGASMQIGSQPLFAMEFKVLSGLDQTDSKVFATESAEERIRWITLCKYFIAST